MGTRKGQGRRFNFGTRPNLIGVGHEKEARQTRSNHSSIQTAQNKTKQQTDTQTATVAAHHDAIDVNCGTGQVGSSLCPSGFGSGVQFGPAQFLGAPADACETKHKTETTKLENTVDETAEAHADAEKAPKEVQSSILEPLDPWLSLDKEELRCVRESCWDNCKAVDTFTPFCCFARIAGQA